MNTLSKDKRYTGLWKFIYWPILWAVTLGIPYILFKGQYVLSGLSAVIAKVIGIVLLIWAFIIHGVAGRTLRYFGHKDPNKRSFWPDKLVTGGIYSCMRHPQHLGLSIVPISLGLLLSSPIVIIASGWSIVGTLLFILFVEEPECLVKFGYDYFNYMKKVKAFSLNPLCVTNGINYIRRSKSSIA